jgi:Cu/Ag efflux protein CusF
MKAMIGVVAAGLLAVGAGGGSSPEQSTSSGSKTSAQTPSQSSSSSASQAPSSSSSATQSPSGASSAGQSTAAAGNELSGVVKKVDKDKHSLTISSSTGGEKEVKVADTATIMRDGKSAKLDNIKEGDDVRASLDASSNQANRLTVESKEMMEKQQGQKQQGQKKY